MKWTAIQRNWPAFTEALMQRFPETEENDLLDLEGDRAALVSYVAERHNLSQAEAERQVKEWEQGAVPADVAMDNIRDGENIQASAAHIGVGEDVYADDRNFGDDDRVDRPIGRDTSS